jgi:Ca2+-binding RTX toxin-like protein
VLRRSTTLVVIALVTGALSAPSSAASAGAQTCQGRPATIVGTGPDIQGTPGDDVIVTGSSQFTYAVAGNDLVCVSPSAVYVYAGDGDDVVDASEAVVTQINAYLGAGLDRYLGGPGQHLVHADGTDDTVTDADWAYLTVTAPVTGTPGTYTGGGIAVWSADHDVEIDLDTDMVTVGGVHAANLSGMVGANVVAPRAVLRGNAADNYLSGSGCDVLFVGRGGSDTLIGGGFVEDAPQIKSECEGMKATMRGGHGDDTIKGWLGLNRLVGNAGNDELQGRSRSDVVLGGSGRDDLRGGNESDVLRGGGGRDDLRGGSGRDDLRGGNESDVLRGGGDRDTADGQNGRDRCVAERERRCER